MDAVSSCHDYMVLYNKFFYKLENEYNNLLDVLKKLEEFFNEQEGKNKDKFIKAMNKFLTSDKILKFSFI